MIYYWKGSDTLKQKLKSFIWHPFADADIKRPEAADLFRVIAIFSVAWFHIWQQSWVSAGKLEFWVRTGYVWVDGLIMLSAFCLFLPYANRYAESGEAEKPNIKSALKFYKRRAVRLIPGYYLSIAAALAAAIIKKGWSKKLAVDLFSHLTFTQMFFKEGYALSDLNGVTWTLTVFAVFYLVFPWITRPMLRRPVITALVMLAVQGGYTWWAVEKYGENIYNSLFNQFPAFSGVIAVGMICAMLYAKIIRCKILKKQWLRVIFTVLGIVSFRLISYMLELQRHSQATQKTQLINRMPLALSFALMLMLFSFGIRLPFRRILSFLSAISFNIYLWHQQLAVWIKYDLKIPYWTGEESPNMLNDTVWMNRYNIICWAVAIISAVLVTYMFEKPLKTLLKK